MRSLAAILFVALTAFGQVSNRKPVRAPVTRPPEAATAAFPLGSVQVSGNRFYSAQQIIGAAGIRIGQPMQQADFDAMKSRLEQTGAFEVVSYRYTPTKDGKSLALKLDVVEALQLFPYKFEDLPATDAELRKVLEQKQPLFAAKLPPSKGIMEQFSASLTEYLVAGKGFNDVVVARVVNEPPGLQILFRPATPVPRIGEVSFQGNQVLDKETLGNAFSAIAIGTSSQESEVRALLDSGVRPLYEAKGLMRVAFGKIETERMKDADGVAIKVEVNEGPKFVFGEVRVTGSGLTNKEAMSNIDIKDGQPVNMDRAKDAVKKLEERLRHYGYMAGKASFEQKLDDKAHKVEIVFQLTPGNQYTFNGLTIQGLDLETEPAIRKMWGLAVGKPYNADYPQHFLDEVKDQGIFDNLKGTRFEQKVNASEAAVGVTLIFVGGTDKPTNRKGRGRDPRVW
jgi:outer membrane protein insertion porin family